MALAVGLVAAFMTLLDVSIVNVAVPSIQAAIGASPSELQWVLSGYALTFGLVLVAAGRFGDARGRRNVFIAGLALFTTASAAAGLAASPEWLIIARLIQGAAAGVVNPQVVGMIQQMFQGPERGRPFGLLGSVIGISTAVGPLLGGLLIAVEGTREGWRLVFFVNVPVGIAAIIFGWRVLPPHRPGPRQSLDPVAVLLLGLGVTLLLLPLIQERQWQGFLKWLLIPAGALVLTAFAYWERRYRRHGEPLFDLALFRHRSYTLGSLIALLYFAGFTALFFVFTLFLQNGLRYSALAAGVAVTPFALGSSVSAILGGRVVNRYGRPLVAGGLIMVATGLVGVMVALHFVPGQGAPFATAVPLLVAGLGSGLVITPNQTLTLAEVPVERGGAAAGMLQTGQRIGSAAGIAGVGTVFFSALAATPNGWSGAFRDALLISLGFVLIALAAAAGDIRAGRRAEHRQGAAPSASGGPASSRNGG
jgi:EmrB/QacA subfamily drug resistance transporter